MRYSARIRRRNSSVALAGKLCGVALVMLIGSAAFLDCDGAVQPEDDDRVGYFVRAFDGNDQVGPAGGVLASEIVAQFSTPDGLHLDGRGPWCDYTVEAGGGLLFTGTGALFPSPGWSSAVTYGQPRSEVLCRARWQLGATPGENRVRVTFGGINENVPNYLIFTATGHGSAAAVRTDAGDGQTGEVNAELSNRLAVRVTDAGGIGVPGMSVWFRPEDGGEPTAGEVPVTGADGVARMPSRWRLGPVTGTQTLIARVLTNPPSGTALAQIANNPITFTATAGPPVPRSMTRNPPSFPARQNGYAGQPVALRPSVRVLDGGGNPVSGVRVEFNITAGGGTFGGALVGHSNLTDQNGVMTVPFDWILGPVPGANTVTATALLDGITGNPITFTADAVANAAPAAIIASPADGSSHTGGAALAFSGSATDAEDGALSGAALAWTSSLDGSIGTGDAFSRTLPPGIHAIVLTATDAAGATGTDSIAIVVTDPNPTASISGRVTGNGNGIGGATVTLSGPASATTTTGGSGNYTFTALPAGTYTLTVSVALNVSFPNPLQTVTLASGQALTVNFAGTY